MPTFIIDNQEVTVPDGGTILDGARMLGIAIPTLCHADGLPHANACMVCLVRDLRTSQMIPACSYPAEEGMALDASSAAVCEARKGTLELLLREHFGDCEAPCRRGCPANMDIAGMMAAAGRGHWQEAGTIARRHIPLPMLLGLICPAPCEKTCRRGEYDFPLRIKCTKYFAGRTVPEASRPQTTAAAAGSMAVVGGGPAGASAAAFLVDLGYACTVFEQAAAPWTALLSKLGEGGSHSKETLRAAASGDYQSLTDKGVVFNCEQKIEGGEALARLQSDYDAVLLAGGSGMQAQLAAWDVVPQDGCRTNRPGVFVCGSARTSFGHMAVRAIRDAQVAVQQIHAAANGTVVAGYDLPYDSRTGALHDGHLSALAAKTSHPDRLATAPKVPASPDEARAEASRCMACACAAGHHCGLRNAAQAYSLQHVRAHPPDYVADGPLLIPEHPEIVFEPGKCIRCGLCVRLAEARGEALGLTFRGRGRQTCLTPPLGTSWADALSPAAARACAEICPTAAISLKEK